MIMRNTDAIVNPVKSKKFSPIGPLAVMAATRIDLTSLCDQFNIAEDDFHRLFLSRLYRQQSFRESFCFVGPFIGAPYAVMLLETLIAWGARRVIFLGWCGAILQDVKIGDIVLPTSAIIDEGTSKHYDAADDGQSTPSTSVTTLIRQGLEKTQTDFHTGAVWTTDAVYRETHAKVENYQKEGILAVEMEISALFSVAEFRSIDLGAILVVSDELSAFNWQPGFKDERFKQGRKTACEVVERLIRSEPQLG
ncbi:MAG: nucleoside phosphorylase [Desulfobacterales bacterium]|jgi:uridine phosphorylase